MCRFAKEGREGGSPYFGGIRSAPSRRIVSPFSIGFSTIVGGELARTPPGVPSRDGNGMPAPSASRCLLGQRGEQRRVEEARRDRHDADRRGEARSRAAGSVSPTIPPFEAA